MRAVILQAEGDQSEFQVGEIRDPIPQSNEVRIRVRAAGFNPADCKMRRGQVPLGDGPGILGGEVSGVIDALGEGADQFAIGDSVCAYLPIRRGGYAELVCTHQAFVARKPESLSFTEAAVVPLAGLTAQLCVDTVNAQATESAFVAGASGGVGSFAVQLLGDPNLPYDPSRDFAPVTQILAATPILLTHTEIPAKTFSELVALAKKSPGQYTAASYGYGTYTHIIIAEMMRASGIDIVHIPYKKSSDGLADVVSGRVAMLVDFYVTSEPYIKSGKLRPLLVIGHKRHRALPGIPTALELGMPRLARRAWGGIVAPAKTPKEILDRLNAEFVKAIRSPVMRKIIEEGGSDIVASSVEEFGLFMKKDREDYARLVKEVGIKIE